MCVCVCVCVCVCAKVRIPFCKALPRFAGAHRWSHDLLSLAIALAKILDAQFPIGLQICLTQGWCVCARVYGYVSVCVQLAKARN